jgi:hypothetical protein
MSEERGVEDDEAELEPVELLEELLEEITAGLGSATVCSGGT